MKIFSYLYNRMLKWSAHRHAPYYLASVSFAESSFFPIPPDVMLVSMGLAKPNSAWQYAFIATVFSVIGGLFGYWLGYFFMQFIEPYILQSSYANVYQHVQIWFKQFGVWIVILAAFTPIPYKLFTLSAGATHMVLGPFIVGSIIGRGLRFFLVAWFLFVFGERFEKHFRRWVDIAGWTLLILIAVYFLTSCGVRENGLAPVEESYWNKTQSTKTHQVAQGETLYAIAFRYDRDYHELAKDNRLTPPYTLHVGQKIKLYAPKAKIIPQIDVPPALNITQSSNWIWPVKGEVKTTFNPRNGQKGINIKAANGQKVRAAASGVVAYAGDGLPGYGNLIIIKHDKNFLTAYGHNHRIRVQEGQKIVQGQVIGDVGIVDRQFWGVHFEIRKQGEPVNPLYYLKKT